MTTDDIERTSDHPPDDSQRNDLGDAERDTLRELVHRSMSCEFAAVNDNKPTTYPLTPFYDDVSKSVVISSPVAYAGKIETVERNPRVSLLLSGPDDEYLVNGVATVRGGDPVANAAYVHKLSSAEPNTPKRAANDKKYDFLDSRLGNALMGWANERVAVEIAPVSMRRIGAATSIEKLPPWPAAEIDRIEANEYERAVLTVVGSDGYPESRSITSVEIRNGAARFDPGPAPTLEEGQPACLLFHWHDEASVYLGQRVVRGRFRTVEGEVRFVPGSCSTLRNDGLRSTLRFVLDGKRRTRTYYEKRPIDGLESPERKP